MKVSTELLFTLKEIDVVERGVMDNSYSPDWVMHNFEDDCLSKNYDRFGRGEFMSRLFIHILKMFSRGNFVGKIVYDKNKKHYIVTYMDYTKHIERLSKPLVLKLLNLTHTVIVKAYSDIELNYNKQKNIKNA